MAKVGIADHLIAFSLGLDLSDLRLLYATDMRRAVIHANLEIRESLFAMAKSGKNTAATIFWLKTRAGAIPASKPTEQKETYPTEMPPPGTVCFVGPNGEIVE